MMKENNYLYPCLLPRWQFFSRGLSFVVVMFAIGLLSIQEANAQCETPINTFPYTEGFEGGIIPECWSNDQILEGLYGGEYFNWEAVEENMNEDSPLLPHSGDYMAQAFLDDYDALTILSTPAFDLTTLNNPQLRFFYANQDWGGDTDWLQVMYRTSSDGEWLELSDAIIDANSSWVELTVPLINAGSEYYIGFAALTNYGYGFNIDDISVEEGPACAAVTALAFSLVDAESGNLTWTSEGVDFDIEWGLAGFTQGEGTLINDVTELTYLFEGLVAGETYDFYVRQDCDGTESDWVMISFLVDYCVPTSNDLGDYISNFNTTNATSNVNFTSTGGSPYTDNTSMIISDFAGGNFDFSTTYVGGTNGVNIWIDWNNNFTFEASENVFSQNSSSATKTGNIVIPEDTPLGNYRLRIRSQWGTGNFPPPCAEIGYGEAEDYTLQVVAAPACTQPSGLTASMVNLSSANLGWTGTESLFEIEWGLTGFVQGEGTVVSNLSGTTYLLEGLTVGNTYQFYVRSDCGVDGFSLWTGPQSVFIGYCPSAPTSNDNSGITNVVVGATSFPVADVFYYNNTGTVIDIAAGTNVTSSVTFGTGYTYHTNIWIDLNDNGIFETNELVFQGESLADNPTTYNTSFSLDVDAPLGQHRMRIGTADTGQNPPNPCYSGTWGVTVDVTVNVTEAPSCLAPSGLVGTATSPNTADVSWTASISEGEGYEYIVSTDNTVPTISGLFVEGTSAAISNLSGNTTYYLFVRTDCGDTFSEWAGPISFTTPCSAVTTLPWTETFEASSTTRACWTQEQVVGTGLWTYNTGSTATITTAHTGTLNARFISVNPGTEVNFPAAKLISPVLDITPLVTPRLVFFYGQPEWAGDQNELKVYYRTSAASAWVEIAHYTENIGVWTEVTLTLPEPSATYQIAFEGLNNWGRANVVDDVTVEETPSCLPPTALVGTATSSSAADISWTAPTPAGVGYEYVVSTSNIAPTENGEFVAETSATLNDLAANTTYYLFVRTDCDGDYSEWEGPVSFTTLCGTVATLPWTETFETSSNTRACWTQIQEVGTASWTYNTGSSGGAITTAHTGTLNARFVSLNADNSPIVKLVSPVLDISSLVNPRVVFFYGQEDWAGDQNQMKVYYRTSSSSEWVEIAYYTGSVAAWTEVALALPEPSATYQLAFEGINNWGRANVVDDVTVEETPSCLPPTSLVADPSGTSVNLTWAADPMPSEGFEYFVSLINETPTENGTATTELTATVDDLVVGNTYYAYVRANCGDEDGFSTWISTSFYVGYCQVTSTSTAYGISNFVTTDGYTNITNASGPGSYNDYTALSVSQSENGTISFTITPVVASTGMGIWIDWNGDYDFEDAGEQVYASGGYVASGTGTITVPAGTPIGGYRMRVVANWLTGTPIPCGNLGSVLYGEAEDYTFMVVAPPACVPPTALTATMVSLTSANLAWVSDGDSFEIEWGVTGFTPGTGTVITGVTELSYLLEGLEEGTTYQFYVRRDCGDDGFSAWSGPQSVYIGYCNSVPTSNDGLGITNVIMGTTSFPVTDVTYYNYTATVVDIAAGTTVPSAIAFATGFTYHANIWIDFDGNGAYEADELVFQGESTAANPTTLDTSFPLAGDVPLGEYRMRIGTADGGQNPPNPCYSGAWGVTIDLRVNVTAPPACIAPIALMGSMADLASANLSWTSDGDAFEIEWGVTGFTPGTGTVITDITELTYLLGGLTEGTTYQFYVRRDCGDDGFSTWAGPQSVYIGYCNSVPTSNDGLGITNVNLGSTSFPVADVTYYNYTSTVVDIAAGTTVPSSISFATGFTYNVNIWIDLNTNGAFEASELVFQGESTAANPTTLDTSFPLAGDVPLGQYKMRIGTADAGQNPPNPCYSGAWGVTIDLMVNITEPPACIAPIQLTALVTSNTTATVSWTSSPAPSGGYQYVVSETPTEPTENGTSVAGNSVDLTDLDFGTVYFYVRSDCGEEDGYSTWSGPLAITILEGDEPCTAVELAISGECVYTSYTTVGATPSTSVPNPSCGNYQGNDVWFAVTVPGNGQVIVTIQDEGIADAAMAMYTAGSCDGTLTQVACNDDTNGLMPALNQTGLTPNTTVYIRLWRYANTSAGSFGICVTTPCSAPATVVVETAYDTATATWPSVGTGVTYNWEVRTAGAGGSGPDGFVQGGTTLEDVTTVTVSGLSYLQPYYFYISTNCSDDVTSGWIASEAFILLEQGCTDPDACNYNENAMEDDGSCLAEPITWYMDMDGDGYGDATMTEESCFPVEGYVTNGTDCDDTDAEAWQSAELYVDADGDGYHGVAETVCYGEEIPDGYTTETEGSDCDDEDNTAWQSADVYVDADGDGYDAGEATICYGEEMPSGYSTETLGDDCDDEDDSVWEATIISVNLVLPESIICDDEGTLTLSGGSPAGGVWSGQSVTDDVFNPIGLVGDYTITYTVSGDGACLVGGSASATIEVDDCSNIEETAANQIKLFPTYTRDNVTVVGIGLTEAVIMDVNGKRLNTVSLNNTSTIDMQSYAAGIYFVHVSSQITSETFRVVRVN